MARFAALVASSLAAGPALAQNMNTEEAQRFVTGKLFSFRCVDGSGGSGRIYADGSVIGKIQSNGSEPERPVWLPPGTLRVQGNLVCASLKGLSFEPCFNLTRTGERSFRGYAPVQRVLSNDLWTEVRKQARASNTRIGGIAYVTRDLILDVLNAHAAQLPQRD